jgi:hypothetical protein
MNKIDLIIDALSVAQNSVWSALNQEALAYAIELKLELAVPRIPAKIIGPNLEEILNAAGFYRGDAVCCNDYEKCIKPCTPKGRWLAEKEFKKEDQLPPVDIGVDVTPEGTHVVACYNRPDAVQEMFYSQFHPLTKPEQSKYSDIVSDGGLDPRNKFDAQPEQEPEIVRRVRRYTGKRRESVSSPHINAKECIALANWIDSMFTAPQRKPWVGLSINEGRDFFESKLTRAELIAEINEFLEEKNK